MKTSILTILESFNGETGLFIERLHHTHGANPREAVRAARASTTLEAGWVWAPEGMGRPALKSVAKVADASGAVICTPEIKAEAIAFAKRAGELELVAYLEAAK
jgi:hypothetical protein